VRVCQPPVGCDNEVPAKLEKVFSGLAAAQPPAGEDQTQVISDYRGAEEHRPIAAIQTQAAVSDPLWIAYGRQWQRHPGNCFRPRLRHHKDFRSCLLNLVKLLPYLAEVSLADNSVKVAQENQQERP
jgi:hypothetical protein